MRKSNLMRWSALGVGFVVLTGAAQADVILEMPFFPDPADAGQDRGVNEWLLILDDMAYEFAESESEASSTTPGWFVSILSDLGGSEPSWFGEGFFYWSSLEQEASWLWHAANILRADVPIIVSRARDAAESAVTIDSQIAMAAGIGPRDFPN